MLNACCDADGQVREALTTSALLQLPMSMGRRAKQQRVDDLLEELVRLLVFATSCQLCQPQHAEV